MKKTRDLIFIILFLLPMAMLAQTTYYVSSSEGNDSNSGKATGQAWKTLEKVNSFKPSPGDQVLFKRGDEWVGTLTVTASGTSGSPITYGAYGTGEKPKIYGSEEITGWTLHSGNIYKAQLDKNIDQLFLDGKKMMLARYPNSSYHIVTKDISSTIFSSTDLNSGLDYSGATAIIRTTSYTFHSQTVANSSSQTITLSAAPTFGFDVNEGFILTNKLTFLDQAGEWFYDNKTNTVYLWSEYGDNPSNHQVRGATNDYGINISNRNYVNIEKIEVEHVNITAVNIINCDYITINELTIKGCDQYGILIPYGDCSNITLENNLIETVSNTGIRSFSAGTTINENSIYNIGMLHSFGKTVLGQNVGTAIYTRGSDMTMQYNKIINCGYDGINFYGRNNMIKYNFIDNAMAVLGDGGGIYTYNENDYSSAASAGSEVMHNIVLNCQGDRDGSVNNWDDGYGIYMDNRIHDIKIQNNTIHNCNCGIYLHEAGAINVIDNNISDCNTMLLTGGQNSYSNYSNNTLYAFDKKDDFIWWSNSHQRFVKEDGASALYNNNTYVNNYNDQDIFNNSSEWSSWKNDSRDANSTFSKIKLNDNDKEKLFYNATKETKIVNLGSGSYKDIFGNPISGSFTLEPFRSKIIIGTSFDSVSSNDNNNAPTIQNQSFSVTGNLSSNQMIGKVIASDPDAGQTLRYMITGGNSNNLFAIDPSTGQILATADLLVSTDLNYQLTVQVSDNASNPMSASATISILLKAEIQAPAPEPTIDSTKPTITGFVIPSSSTNTTIAVETFTASDNVGVTGYQLSETNTAPNSWLSTPPSSYTFSSTGNKTLYAWAKDAAGNISSPSGKTINITTPVVSSDHSEFLFEETAGTTVYDSKGNVDGTIVNQANHISGVKGNGLELDGTSYISLGKSFGNNITNKVTMSAWIKPASAAGDYQGVIMHGGANFDSFALYIRPSSTLIGFKTSGTTNEWTSVSAPSLFDGDWHHLAVSYDGSKKTIYLDNLALTEVSASGNIASGVGYNLFIGAGRDENPPKLLYTGAIDEVNIYNYALNSSEISELYYQVKNYIPSTPSDKESGASVNQSPVINNQSFQVSESMTTNAYIGSISASDPDLNQTLTYAIVSGNGENLFKIDPSSGDLYTNQAIGKNLDKTVSLQVSVSDNGSSPLSANANVTISINTVEPNQSPAIQNQSFQINSVTNPNMFIGKVSASDPNSNQELSYSITSGNGEGLFTIEPTTGNLFTAQAIEKNINKTVSLTVTVTDNGTAPLSSSAVISVAVNTVEPNLSPVISDQTFDISKSNKSSDLIGQIIASDPNTDQSLTFSIVESNDYQQIILDPNTGELHTDKSLLLTTNQTINLLVKVTDNGIIPLSAQATITINVIVESKLVNGEVNGNKKNRITLYYSDPLQGDSNLKSAQRTTDFTINGNKVVKKVSIEDTQIHLDVDSDFSYDDQIIVSYLKESSPIYDQAGNEIESFTNYVVDNNLTKEVTTDVEVAFNNEGSMEVQVYPNPSSGVFTLRADNLTTDACTISMYAMTGSLVSQKEMYSTFGNLEERVDMSHLPSGTYIVHLLCDNQTAQSKIIIR